MAFRMRVMFRVGIVTLVTATALLAVVPHAHAQSQNYYVDAVNGSDTNSGNSPQSAWKSVRRAFRQNYEPGDVLLIRRGQIYSEAEEVVFTSSGTADRPITIGSYDSGEKPILGNASPDVLASAVRIQGDHVAIRDLHITNTNGHGLRLVGNHLVAEFMQFSRVGIAVEVAGSDVQIRNNLFYDLHMIVSDEAPDNDYGAMGVLVYSGENIAVTGNEFVNILDQSLDYGTDGAALEIYAEAEVRNITFAYNHVESCDNVFEAGSADASVVEQVYIHHNIVDKCNGLMAVHTIGSSSGFQVDIDNVYVDNNTLNNVDSLWIADSPSPANITVRNNVFSFESIADVFFDGDFTHVYNVYYAPDLIDGAQIGITLDPTETIVDPLLNFNLVPSPGSPLVNAGTDLVSYPRSDYSGVAFPQDGRPDIGAVEWISGFWIAPIDEAYTAAPLYQWLHIDDAIEYEISLSHYEGDYAVGNFVGTVGAAECSSICSVDLTILPNKMIGTSAWLSTGRYVVFVNPLTATNLRIWRGPFLFEVK